MKKFFLITLTTSCLTIFPDISNANNHQNVQSALDLQRVCISEIPTERAFCIGALYGAMSVVELFTYTKQLPPSYCLGPSELPIEQGRQVFLKWANEHPQYLHLNAMGVLIISYMQAFCNWNKDDGLYLYKNNQWLPLN